MVKTHVKSIAKNVYLLRVDDDRIKYFEALWEIPEGITYNAYLIDTGEKRVLIDTWKHVYSKEFIDVLKSIVDLRDIDYIVVNHMEPDHSGSLPHVLEENRFKATVIGHPMAASMIKSFYGISPKFRPVRDNEKLDIGGDASLYFIHVPWLHWPETIMTYFNIDHVLFSCDVFGSYGIPKTVFDEDTEALKPLIRKYFATVIGHYREWVIKNIDKITGIGLAIDVIAPSHGVVWRNNPGFIIDYYKELALQKPSSGKVVVLYASMYGFIEKAVGRIADIIRNSGFNVVLHRIGDADRCLVSEVISDVNDASGIVIGVPTYEADVFPLMNYIVNLIVWKTRSSKPVLVVSAYGWGGVAGKKISKILSDNGFRVTGVIEFRSGLSSDVEEKIVDETKKFLQELRG